MNEGIRPSPEHVQPKPSAVEHVVFEAPPILTEKGRQVLLGIFLRFRQEHPLGGVNLQSVGDVAGLTRERARQLHKELKRDYDIPPIIKSLPRSKDYLAALNRERRRLKREGLIDAQIAERLHVPVFLLKLTEKKERERAKKARDRFDKKVKVLRKQNLGDKAIAASLGTKVERVSIALERIRKKDETARLRRKRRSKEELAQFHAKVKELREQGLTNKEITQKIEGATFHKVADSVKRLLAREEVARRGIGPIKKDNTLSFDLALLTSRQQGKTRKEIAKNLRVGKSTVDRALRRLADAGLVTIRKQARKKS